MGIETKIHDFVESLPSEKDKLTNVVSGELNKLKSDYENYIVGLEADKLQKSGIVDFFEERLLKKEEIV